MNTAPVRCTVQLCDAATTETHAWETDVIGQPFCPHHPVATSCRMCGRNKHGNRVLCRPCAHGDTPPTPAPAHPLVSAGHCGDCYRAWAADARRRRPARPVLAHRTRHTLRLEHLPPAEQA